MKDTSSFCLEFGGKIYYFDCHRCFLPLDHPFRMDNDAFKKGNIVLEGLPRCLSGPEIVDMLEILVSKENVDEFVGYGKEHNWIHKCALWELPYAKALILKHNIDLMHKERNVGETIAFTDKTKDNNKARKVPPAVGVIVLLGLHNTPHNWISTVGPSLPGFTTAPCVDSLLCYRSIKQPKSILQDSPKV
jgi:hypothetical protein